MFLHGMAISLGISVIPRGNWKQKYDEIFFLGGGGGGGLCENDESCEHLPDM